MNPFKENEDPDLPEDFFRKWEDSQVFIYYKTGLTNKIYSEYPYPNCFGNLITADYVITATSCFMDLKKFVKGLRDQENDRFLAPLSIFDLYTSIPLNDIIKTAMKSDISKITIAKVLMCFVITFYLVQGLLYKRRFLLGRISN